MKATSHKVIIGDARRMNSTEDGSVQLIVTSPPYWQLKDYGNENQIGFGNSYEDYINNLSLVWSECHRVLCGGCRLCINIGDQFARSVYYGRYKVIPIKTEIIKFCEAAGFDYMGTIIWRKKTTTNTTGGGSVMGSYPYPRNGVVKIDYESILIFKKTGPEVRQHLTKEAKEKSKLTGEEWNTYFSGHWNFKGERQNKHLAMFPLELPERLIKMFSFAGETVLDPFLGSGTTSLAAINLERNSVGYEINRDFSEIIKRKLGVGENVLLDMASVEFVDGESQSLTEEGRSRRVVGLPYVFRDTVRIERKVDPKKFAFGSKIDGNGNGLQKNHFYKVREITGPDKLVLSGGVKVRLIGVSSLKGKETDAVSFMRKKVRGQKVFMKFDQRKYDEDNNLFCYLYLSNRTFINAHLIKSGLVSVDRNLHHRHLNRFIKYQKEAENG